MTTPRKELSALPRYVFRVPRWPVSTVLAFVVAAVAGVGILPSTDVGVRVAIFGIAVGGPTLLASVTTAVLARWAGAPLTFDRASLLGVVCETAVLICLLLTTILVRSLTLSVQTIVPVTISSLALLFAFRVFVESLLFGEARWTAIASASIQPLGIGIVFFNYEAPGLQITSISTGSIGTFGLLLVTGSVYGVLTLGLLAAFDRPLQQEFDIGLSAFVSAFVTYLSGDPTSLESFFDALGEDVVVPITVLSFREPNGDEQAQFILPSVHPGPMKGVGGGKLPVRLAETATGLAFPLHSMTGHDFDIVTDRGVNKIARSIEDVADRIEYTPTATPGNRTETDGTGVIGQAFGDDVLLVTTFAPRPTDDIAYSVGLVADAEARRMGFDSALVADAHNSDDGAVGRGVVAAGTPRSTHIVRAVRQAAERLDTSDQSSLEIGLASQSTPVEGSSNIGALGIRVALTRVDGRTTAYVLVDGNNMVPRLRERIIDTVSDVDTVEIVTTDTHAVNTVSPTKRVGENIDESELLDTLDRLVTEARDDLSLAEAGLVTTWTEVTAFGDGSTARFAAIGFFLASLGRLLVVVAVAATAALTAVVFHLAGIL